MKEEKSKDQIIEELRQKIKELEKEENERERVERWGRTEQEKKAILDSMSEHVVYQDTQNRILWTNKAAGDSVGMSPEELVGHHCYEIWPQRSDPCPNCPVIKARETGQPQKTEITTPDGRVWFIRGYPIRDAKGNVIALVEVTLEITEHKRVEESLRESEEKYRTLTENINIGLYRNTVGPKGKFIEANPAIARMFVYSDKEEFLKINVSDLYQHPNDRKRFNKKMLKDGFVRNEELQLKKKDRTPFYGSVSAVAVKDEKGKVKYYDGMIEDITERKKVEKKLKESEERYRSVVENSHDGILIVGEDYKFTYVNDELCKILLYSRDEIVGHDFREFLDEESKKLVADRYIRRQRGEKVPPRYEFDVLRRDGEKRRVEISSTVIKDSTGKLWTVAQILDITEHKKAEEKLSTIYNLSKEMSLSLDLDQISKIVLDATEKVLNFGNVDLFLLNEEKNELHVKEARGLKELERYIVLPLYGEKGISAHVARTGKSLNIPDVRKDERYLLGLKGAKSELCVSIKVKDKVIGVIDAESKELNAFSEEDQRLLETLASQAAIAMENARLFSEEKKAREQREKSRKEAEFYADVLGHDVGNINQIISGYLYLLENAKDEETRKKNVRGIKKSIMKSKRLAESMKTLKIIKDTKIEKFDLNKSIERSIKNIKEYSDREIEVNLNIDKKYYVKANDFLDKVFFNILENAVEYTFHDPVIIDVRTEEKDDFCNVHICDNGIGISKEKREGILENLETLSKRTGIGFYLTKKILDRFNGKFEIKDVKKGTEIVVSIPVRP